MRRITFNKETLELLNKFEIILASLEHASLSIKN